MFHSKILPILLTAVLLNACALPDATHTTSHKPNPTQNIQKGKSYRAKVMSVADGDTLTVEDIYGTKHKLRLAFIDAPEIKQNHGTRSRDSLSQLLLNQNISVTVTDIDRYKREVALVNFNKENVNYRQVLLGNAWHYTQYAKTQDAAEYKRFQIAQAAAKQQRSGLWAYERPLAPWDYRKQQRANTKK